MGRRIGLVLNHKWKTILCFLFRIVAASGFVRTAHTQAQATRHPRGALSMTQGPQCGAYTLLGQYVVRFCNPTDQETLIEAQARSQWTSLGRSAALKSGDTLAALWTIFRRPLDEGAAGQEELAGVAGTAPQGAFLEGDEGLLKDEEAAQLILSALGGGRPPSPPRDGVELVSWVDSNGQDLLGHGLPRLTVHKLNVLHKGAGILVRNTRGDIFVHRRAAHKRIFPSMYDMFVGGVSLFGEATDLTARRELKEELGFGAASQPFRFMYRCLVETSLNRCVVDVWEYVALDEEEVQLDPEEVQWGEFMPLQEVHERVAGGQWAFVPDGLLVWGHQLDYWEKERQQ